MKRISAVLALVCCAHTPAAPECVTPCGLRATENCAELIALERATVAGFAKHVEDWTEAKVCGALNGWRVQARVRKPSDVVCHTGWVHRPGFCVAGYTDDKARTIELHTATWAKSHFAHEVVHVVDLALTKKAGHCRWYERGIKRAIFEIDGRVDTSNPERSCNDSN